MKSMISDFKHLRKCSLLGLVLVVSACFPQSGSKVYPYNYDAKKPYYLTEVEGEISGFDSLTDEEIFLRAQQGTKDVSYSDMDQTREIQGKKLFAPLEGMVFTPLFSKPVKSDYERFLRLEHAVQILRNDIDVLIPKVFKMPDPKLVEVVEPIRARGRHASKPSLIIKHEAFDTNTPVSISSSNVEAVEKIIAKRAPKKVRKHKAKKAYKVVARGFRRADHKDKTRIVIDLSAKQNVNTVLSGDGRRLIVDLSSVSWRPKKIWNAVSGKLISGYKLKRGNKLFIDLMYKSKVAKKMLIKPNRDSRNYRLVIDLVSPHLHKRK